MRFTKFINRASFGLSFIRSRGPVVRLSVGLSDDARSRGPKLWQGLLTLPLGRPKVSNPKPGGELWSSRRRGLETRAEPPAHGGVWRPAPNRACGLRNL